MTTVKRAPRCACCAGKCTTCCPPLSPFLSFPGCPSSVAMCIFALPRSRGSAPHELRIICIVETSTHKVGVWAVARLTHCHDLTSFSYRQVFVGNLPPEAESRDLRDLFRDCGNINDAWVARKPPGFGFVWFDDERDAVLCASARPLGPRLLHPAFAPS